jgi:hypothetical protein
MQFTTIPWSAGVPNISGSNADQNAYWRLCAKTFSDAGFSVTWGCSTGKLTASNWDDYHDSIVSEAAYLQSQNIALYDFEAGNELASTINTSITQLSQIAGVATATTGDIHGFSTGDTVDISGAVPSGYNGSVIVTRINAVTFTYSVSPAIASFASVTGSCSSLTIAEVQQRVRDLATDIKAVYTLGDVSYGCEASSGVLNDWIVNGLGGLDTISIHPYSDCIPSSQTINPDAFTRVASMMNAFPTSCYISEFNIDAEASPIYQMNPPLVSSRMKTFFDQYIIGNNVPIYITYMWSGYLNQNNDFAVGKYIDDGTNPMFYTFFQDTPTQYARTRGTSITRAASASRPASVTRTSYINRPVFNNS